MKRKIVVLANGRNVTPAGATCRMIASDGPSSEVTASGSASVIQNTITNAITAASRCASGESDWKGQASTSKNIKGPATMPTLRLDSSNRSSASVLVGVRVASGVTSGDMRPTIITLSAAGLRVGRANAQAPDVLMSFAGLPVGLQLDNTYPFSYPSCHRTPSN